MKLYRELIKKPIWKQSTPEQKSILITILCMVNHDTEEWEWKGEKYTCKPGQTITSLQNIAREAGKGISVKNVRTALERFQKLEFLANESTNQNRLITVLNWELYQSKDAEPASKQASDRQTTGKRVATNKNDKNDKNDKNIYSSSHMAMAEKLKSLILSNNPGAKTPKDLTKWAAEFERMERLDKRSPEQINAVMEFSQKDLFWKSNILSPKKLREKYDTLWLQKDRPKPQPGTPTKAAPQKGNFTQRKYTDEEIEKLYSV